jgi:predicted nucleotidyltransferase
MIAASHAPEVDSVTKRATTLFMKRVAADFPVRDAFLFGSRTRPGIRTDSDTDLAVVLRGERQDLSNTLIRFADIAYDVMLATGRLVDAHPVWEREWDQPQTSSNPALVANMKREGVRL